MPQKGYKQTKEHRIKKDKFLTPFTGGHNLGKILGKQATSEERKKRLSYSVWKSVLKNKYGISVDIYEELLKKQDFRCAICGVYPDKKNLSVDHNHSTKKVRGLLCFACNIAIGHLKENEQILQNAIQYLRKHKE